MMSYKYPVTGGGVAASKVCEIALELGVVSEGFVTNPHRNREIGDYFGLSGDQTFLAGKCIFLLIFEEKLPKMEGY